MVVVTVVTVVTHQHVNTSSTVIHQHIDPSHINRITDQLVSSTPTHQHNDIAINTPTHQHVINPSTD
jgi:hypothetical protein